MHTAPDAFHIGSEIITRLEQEIRSKGYSLTLHIITDEDIASLTLPPNLNADQTAAVICLEIFHPEYSRLICSLELPVLFIDANADFYSLNLRCDLLLMENRSSVYRMLTSLCRKHRVASMGFVGDNRHCLSFRERYESLVLAAHDCNVDIRPYHIIADDCFYSDPAWMLEQLKGMAKLPDLFFCANDVLAQVLVQSLAELGRQVPRDVLVCGFDGIPTLNPFMNSLTTVRIPCGELGIHAAQLLFQRVQNPGSICAATYVSTEICFRESAPFE